MTAELKPRRALAEELEAALCAPNWSASLAHVHEAVRLLSAAEAMGREGQKAADVPCGRCQGNGEIITDWARYLRSEPGDVGDEGTAECPDCGGTGQVSPAEGQKAPSPAVPEGRAGRLSALAHDIERCDLFGGTRSAEAAGDIRALLAASPPRPEAEDRGTALWLACGRLANITVNAASYLRQKPDDPSARATVLDALDLVAKQAHDAFNGRFGAPPPPGGDQRSLTRGQSEADLLAEYTAERLAARNLDFLDAKAEAWMDQTSVAAMFRALADVFDGHASPATVSQFRDKLEALAHLCFVEGAFRAWCDITDERAALSPPRPEPDGWRAMSEAPRDGTYVLAVVAGATDRWEHLNGRAFVIRYEGTTASGFDLGWSVYPGFGGTHDSWFSGWKPLGPLPPPPLPGGPATPSEEHGDDGQPDEIQEWNDYDRDC